MMVWLLREVAQPSSHEEHSRSSLVDHYQVNLISPSVSLPSVQTVTGNHIPPEMVVKLEKKMCCEWVASSKCLVHTSQPYCPVPSSCTIPGLTSGRVVEIKTEPSTEPRCAQQESLNCQAHPALYALVMRILRKLCISIGCPGDQTKQIVSQ